MWMCVSLLCLCGHRSGTQQDFTRCVCQKLTDSQQPDRQMQLDTDKHATATPLCGPTRYDLHLRDGTERGRGGRGRRKRELDSGGMKRAGEAPVCLLWTALFLPCVEFWQAAPAVWIRQPSLPWSGEEGRHVKSGEGGRGEGLRGVGGQGERAGADWGL